MDLELKSKIRVQLFRCAFAGRFLTYSEFFALVHPSAVMGQWPYTSHFNMIAEEERSHGYPDITFVVFGKDNRYPHQIDFRDARPRPDAKQLISLREGTDNIIRVYCPLGTPNPY